ncbi:MAG TPA: hypothetical protein C5S37_02485 [Methanophagales archaeon]|nr:hypothetical protein [Methanophagales archaeon]
MKRKTIVGLIVAIVVVAMFVGCVEKPPSAPTVPTPTPETVTQKTELSLGESAILDDIEFTVVRFEERHEYEYEHESFFNESIIINETVYPPEGAKFLWVYVIAKNVGEVAREVPDSLYDIKMLYKGEEISTQYLVGSEFTRKREIYDSSGMFSDPLYPGVTDEGWILFEVPEGIDLSQAKIHVESPTNYKKNVTWSF